jgi:hypothetical protein
MGHRREAEGWNKGEFRKGAKVMAVKNEWGSFIFTKNIIRK